jgi:hypothetical protein
VQFTSQPPLHLAFGAARELVQGSMLLPFPFCL